ncbi:MAG TPA: SDR family oxidoreductase [Steroidobacteraceae bacterium]|nr:SDR family oxidoreductase [Steroidobacteraceae bacterium]
MLQIGDLDRKRVLVTGASSGIGAAVVQAFAQQGAQVALHFRSHAPAANALAERIRGGGGTVVLVQGDLSESGVAARVVEEAARALGGLDILVNNAGAIVGRRPILEADDEFLDAVFDLNARAVLGACRAAIPHLEQSAGVIINVGSIAGLDGGGSGAGIYASSKAFVHNLTRHLARDLAAKKIRVNAVSPGVIETPFHATTPPERMEAMRKSVPLGRAGVPNDCVGAFLFLASGELSGYITGQIIHVNGGQVMP